MMGTTPASEMQAYRVREVEQLLGVSRSTVYALMTSGQLAYVKIGRCRRIPHTSVAALLERVRQK